MVSCSYDKVCVLNAHNAELHCELHCEINFPLYDGQPSCFDFSPISGCLVGTPDESSRAFLWRLDGVLD